MVDTIRGRHNICPIWQLYIAGQFAILKKLIFTKDEGDRLKETLSTFKKHLRVGPDNPHPAKAK
jgi:hypothetical protein